MCEAEGCEGFLPSPCLLQNFRPAQDDQQWLRPPCENFI
jgi:hypothetical protein